MTNKMELVKKCGLMEQDTRETISKERNTESGNSFGQMHPFTKGISNSTTFKALVYTSGLMDVNMMVSG